MLKASYKVGESLTRKIFFLCPRHYYPLQSLRKLSTNSAIGRGIRRGRSSSFGDDGRSRTTGDGRRAGRAGAGRAEAWTRPGRREFEDSTTSRYERRHDVQDGRTPAKMRGWRRDPRGKTASRPIGHRNGARDKDSKSSTTGWWTQQGNTQATGEGSTQWGRNRSREPRSVPREKYRPFSRQRHPAERQEAWQSTDSLRDSAGFHGQTRDRNYLNGSAELPITSSNRRAIDPTQGEPHDHLLDFHDGSRANQTTYSSDNQFSASERSFARDRSSPMRSFTSKDPLSIPYTTSASEFLYGRSVVLAALQSRRRKMYQLYVLDGGSNWVKDVEDEDADRLESIKKYAAAAGVKVTSVNSSWVRLMDKMSNGRPHNVCCGAR